MEVEKLSKAMISCIELELSEPDITQRQIAERLGKHLQTIHNWRTSKVYKDELARRLREEWQGYVKSAQNKMRDLADSPDEDVAFKACKYILDSAGYNAEEKINVNGGLSYHIDYGDDDEKD